MEAFRKRHENHDCDIGVSRSVMYNPRRNAQSDTMNENEKQLVRSAMKIIGGIKSPAKAAASRANGAKGGRPSHGIGDRREIYRACLREFGDLRAMTPDDRARVRAESKAKPDAIILGRINAQCNVMRQS